MSNPPYLSLDLDRRDAELLLQALSDPPGFSLKVQIIGILHAKVAFAAE